MKIRFVWTRLRTWLSTAGALGLIRGPGKVVSTPGMPGYAETIFTQMHYGVTADLAARALWLLAVAAIGATLVSACVPGRSARQ